MLTHRDIYQTFESRQSNGYKGQLYCLIDHASMPGVVTYLTSQGVAWSSLFAHTGQESALQAAPILFEVTTKDINLEDRNLLDKILQLGTYNSCLMFLVSTLPMDVLTERLTKRLDAVLPDNMDILLRYYDPRTFENLLSVLKPEQIETFLSVAHAWWFVDRRGTLQTMDAQFAELDQFTAPLTLNQAQEAALLDNSEADQIAQLLRENVANDYARVPASVRYDFIVKHKAASEKINIEATHEKALYCAMALLHGEKFDQLSNWKPVLKDVADGKITMTDAPNHVSENEQIWPEAPATT